MGNRFKTAEEKFEYRMSKQSIEREICILGKPKKTWETGWSIKKLKKEVEIRKGRNYSKGRIYEAVSLINRFGKPYGIYLRSAYGFVEDENNKRKKEYRYFVPTDVADIMDEKRHLESREEILQLKGNHLEHHHKITIPQERKIQELDHKTTEWK